MLKIKAKKGSTEVEYESDKDATVSFTEYLIREVVESVVKIYEEEYREKENNQQD